MASLANDGLPTRLGFNVLNTEERRARTDTRTGWADRPRPFWAQFWLSLLDGSSLALWIIGPSIVGFGRRYLRDQVEGSL
jgi:hypothetical protein